MSMVDARLHRVQMYKAYKQFHCHILQFKLSINNMKNMKIFGGEEPPLLVTELQRAAG